MMYVSHLPQIDNNLSKMKGNPLFNPLLLQLIEHLGSLRELEKSREFGNGKLSSYKFWVSHFFTAF